MAYGIGSRAESHPDERWRVKSARQDADGSALTSAPCRNVKPGVAPAPESLVEQAARAHQQGAIDVAERLCLDVLELAPDQAGALAILYRIRKNQGDEAAAEILIRRVVAQDPNNFAATNELSLMLLARGAIAAAEEHARNAIRIAPETAQAHNLMGMIMTEAQRLHVGEYHYRKVIELSGARDPILLANLAWNLKNQGRMDESRALYRESAAAAPDIRQTLLGWARLEEADRKFGAAAELLDRMEALWSEDPGMLLSRAVLLGRMKRYDEAVAVLDRMAGQAADGCLGPDELAQKGRLLDQMGRYDDAFDAFEEGKRLARELAGHVYQDAIAENLIGRLRSFFTAQRVNILPRAKVRTDVAQPIFVCGFPRSGTTLVEQTLSAHPRIVAGDELPLINDITELMPRVLNSPLAYPEALAELWMGDQREGLDTLRDYYLQKVRQMGIVTPGAAWFTDKMPLNETHLGLIALLFPQSPLIHVIRHPLDVMVSALSHHFTHGFFCAGSLGTAARHYIRVMDLAQSYRTTMGLRYLTVHYEAMLDDQEAAVRAMFDFIGESFDPRCLAFHENQRYARTASYAQVTEKLYDRSRFRYRFYRRSLEPVVPILRPAIERLGYRVDWDLPATS